MNIFKIKPIFLSNLFWCKTVVQYNYNKTYIEQKNLSEGAALRQERSPRRGARRVGEPTTLRSVNKLQFI